jgi:hypothetical protein
VIDFSDMSGGKNNTYPAHAIAQNQVSETLNAMHEKIGISRAPGYRGVTETALFSAPCTGFFNYVHDDGTESIIAVSDGKVYRIDNTDWTLDEIGAMTGTGECYSVNATGKLWICNGTEFVKVENDLSVFRVQIVAPSDGAASAISGGTLADGVYGVYVSYARYDSTTGQYLYSLPQSLGNKTCGAGSNTIRVTLTDSTDTQVNRVVVFMTDAGGAIPFYYKEATVTTPGARTIDVTSSATRNGDILMTTVSTPNQILPYIPTGICYFDDQIFVWSSSNPKTVYWSIRSDVNAMDLERFVPENFRVLPFGINAMFGVGSDLFFNHIGNGVSIASMGNVGGVIKNAWRDFWFLDCKTDLGKSNVVYVGGAAFGLTNDGFRLFNGQYFTEDLSAHIKPDIDLIRLGTGIPSATVYRRPNKRTEYRFSFNNFNYGNSGNNDQRVFNIDFYSQGLKTWECWENGFTYSIIFGGVILLLQNGASDAQVVQEVGKTDVYCYDRSGAFMASSALVKQLYVLGRTVIPDLDSIYFWGAVYALATSSGTISGNVIIFDENNSKFPFEVIGVPSGLAILPSEASGEGLELPFILAPQYPIRTNEPGVFNCRGSCVSVEISQSADDENFFLYKLQLPRVRQEKSNIT